MKKKPKPSPDEPVTKLAFSYIRFSSKKQEHGSSLARQLQATRAYCKANGLLLDERLSFQDLGVSAFRGKNRERGLGEFLAACDAGLIPPGSALVVEALDRISRQRPRAVAGLLSQLLDGYGLEVHLTGIKKVLYPDSPTAADEGMDLLLVVMLAVRASEEQETKADRLKKAFALKRQQVANGEILMETNPGKLPWWITCVGEEEKAKLVVPKERGKVVKKIFQWSADGLTAPVIARKLREQGIDTYRERTKHWTADRVRDLIKSRAPEGYLEQTPKSKKNGLEYSIPDYYPVLIDADLASKARLAMTANRKFGRKHEIRGTGERPINILRGIIRLDGRWCNFHPHPNGKKGILNGYYTSYDKIAGKYMGTVSSLLLEPTLLAGLSELKPEDMAPEEDKLDPAALEIVRHQSRLAEVKKGLQGILKAIKESGYHKTLTDELIILEGEEKDLQEKINSLSIRVRSISAAGSGKKELMELKSFLDADLRDNTVRRQIADLLKRLVERIEVSYEIPDKVRGLAIRTMLEGSAVLVPDPLPAIHRRKAMGIVVHFRRGGRRVIIRFPEATMAKLNFPNMLFSGRIELLPPLAPQ